MIGSAAVPAVVEMNVRRLYPGGSLVAAGGRWGFDIVPSRLDLHGGLDGATAG